MGRAGGPKPAGKALTVKGEAWKNRPPQAVTRKRVLRQHLAKRKSYDRKIVAERGSCKVSLRRSPVTCFLAPYASLTLCRRVSALWAPLARPERWKPRALLSSQPIS